MTPTVGYLTDDHGHKSAIRLYGLISLLAGIGLAFWSVHLDSDLGGWLAITLIGSAYGGKVSQKLIEKTRAR